MRRITCWAAIGFFSVLAYLGLATTSPAVYIDEKGTLQFTARLQTRASIRLNHAEGFTFPNARVGDLVQQRNPALLEVDHDLNALKEKVDLLYPLRPLGIDVKYRLVGRFMYEGVYDYGPQIFQDIQAKDSENIDTFSHQYDLWECYADLSRGPWFLRIGRQNLAWGETSQERFEEDSLVESGYDLEPDGCAA
jgi:hypothetical protein